MNHKRHREFYLIKLAVILMFCSFLAGAGAFTYSHPYVKVANMFYKREKYSKSLEIYLKAVNKVKDKEAINFNIANAYYKLNDFDNALKYYEKSLKAGDMTFNATVMFNMGNSYFKTGELVKAFEKYKASLKLNPGDKRAKYNLEYALSMISESKKRRGMRPKDEQKSANRRDGGANPDIDLKAAGEQAKSEEIQRSLTNPSDLDDITKEDANRILSALTQEVMVKAPMRKDELTKKGEQDEKDW